MNSTLEQLQISNIAIIEHRRIYRVAGLDTKLEWAFALVYHIVVVGGVALTAAGSAKLQSHEEPIDKAEKIVKAGIAILTVCWVALVAVTGLTFAVPARKSVVGRAGTTVCLLYPVLILNPFADNTMSSCFGLLLLH